ncbi:MAG: hypothetical protein WAS07_10410 [Micropruina sp.]
MPNLLDTLEALERQATPGPHRVSLKLGGCEVVDGQGEWLAEFERAEDAEHYAAARNALPALLRVARAAMDTLAEAEENYADAGRDGETDAYCTTVSLPELRAALAALDAAGEGE